MLKIKITGLDKLQNALKEAQQALKSLDGPIAALKFNPNDPQSVQNAIRQMEAAVDSKVSLYRNNTMVSELVQELKNKYRQNILKRTTSTDQ